jgi:L-fuconolactonase
MPCPMKFLPHAGPLQRAFLALAACLVLATLHPVPARAAEPGVIDCHVHLWTLSRPDGVDWIKKDDRVLYRDYLPVDFETETKANGVGGVVLVQAGQSIPDNQWNLDITAHNRKLYRGLVGNLSRVIGSDGFRPLFAKLCKDSRYLGYRLSGRYQEGLSEAFYRDLDLTAEAGKSVDFLIGQYSLKDVDAIARRVPKLRIILDHVANIRLDGKPLDPGWVADFRAAAKHPNVHCKVSALYGRVEKQPAPKDADFYRPVLDLAFDSFGEDRLIFGSDWPVSRTSGDYASVLALTRAYFEAKGPGVCEKLFQRNAAGFYAIPAAD